MWSIVEKIERFNIAVGSLSGVVTFLMMVIIIPDIATRNALNISITGASETSVALLVILVFLGLAGAQTKKAHFRVGVLDSLLDRNLAGKIIRILGIAASIAMFAALAWLTTKTAIRSYQQGEVTVGLSYFVIWPQRVFIAVGIILLTLQLLIDLARVIANKTSPFEPTLEEM